MSDADFDSLSNALDGCFDMPLAELPAELSARIAFPWDAIEPDQRRFAAYWWDCRHNPSNEEENNASSHVAWYDSTLNAATWWSLSRITPKEAAMLLCQFDPHDEKCDPLEITNDETGPIDYKILLRALEGVAEQDPTPRSLIDWLSVARTRRLKHHSWAERYERAVQVLKAADLKLHQDTIIAVPPASEVPEAAPEVSDSSGDHGEQEDRAQEGSTGTWHVQVRAIADDEHRKAKAAGYDLTKQQIAERVAGVAEKMGIRGAYAKLTPANILREALQGNRWKRPSD